MQISDAAILPTLMFLLISLFAQIPRQKSQSAQIFFSIFCLSSIFFQSSFSLPLESLPYLSLALLKICLY